MWGVTTGHVRVWWVGLFLGVRKAPPWFGWGLSLMGVRRCPTLPPRLQGSTIGAEGLSFRVRNGTGRFPPRYGRRNSCELVNTPHPGNFLSCESQSRGVVLVVREPHSGRVAFSLTSFRCGEVIGLLVPVSSTGL